MTVTLYELLTVVDGYATTDYTTDLQTALNAVADGVGVIRFPGKRLHCKNGGNGA